MLLDCDCDCDCEGGQFWRPLVNLMSQYVGLGTEMRRKTYLTKGHTLSNPPLLRQPPQEVLQVTISDRLQGVDSLVTVTGEHITY